LAQVGYAIIGSTGYIGKVHISAISQLNNCRLVGVYARTPEPLRQQAAALGVKPYAALADALTDTNVDAIIIATPHPSHLEIALNAAAAGKHILVEKPMAVTPSEADTMIAAARHANVKLGVLFNQRFRPDVRKMRELLDRNAIGKIYRTALVHATMRTQDYYDRLAWRGTWRDEGGGVLLNQGIHSIDLFQWLGGMPQSLYSRMRAYKHTIEVEDYASALLEYADGVHGTLHCNTVQAPNQIRVELWGELGAMIYENGVVTLHRLETPVQEFIDTDTTADYIPPRSESETLTFEPSGTGHIPAIGDFADAILHGREPYVNGEEGRKSQELIAAITLSSCTGSEVKLPVDRARYDALLEALKKLKKLPTTFLDLSGQGDVTR
jgi:predicted dehydrogenase